MAKLPYVMEADVSSEDTRELYREIIALRGGLVNLYRVLANNPASLRAFMTMSRHVRDENSLPEQLRELAILATAFALDVRYEQNHHLAAARRVGVSEAKLKAFPRWHQSGVFDAREHAVLAYADQVSRTRRVEDATFAAATEVLTVEQLVDLAVTVAWYHFCAALIMPLEVDEERAAPLAGGHGS